MILSILDLMDIYNKSVGRGSVLLLNATPDTTGLIPESHVARYKAFGEEIARRFNKPLASVSGKGNVLDVKLKKAETVNCIAIGEDISQGQRVRKFELEGFSNGQWTKIKEGTSVGSKRIEEFPTVRVSKVRLRIIESVGSPVIQNLALYNIEQSRQTNDNSKNTAVTLSGWDNKTFSTEWQDFSLDLTAQFVEKVGQFELNFRTFSNEMAFDKAKESGLEFKNWQIELYGAVNTGAIQKKENGIFLINNSQDINSGTNIKVIFKTQIRRKGEKTEGKIELKTIDFE
jgi:alpha-L-fucosidase